MSAQQSCAQLHWNGNVDQRGVAAWSGGQRTGTAPHSSAQYGSPLLGESSSKQVLLGLHISGALLYMQINQCIVFETKLGECAPVAACKCTVAQRRHHYDWSPSPTKSNFVKTRLVTIPSYRWPTRPGRKYLDKYHFGEEWSVRWQIVCPSSNVRARPQIM